MNVIATWAMKWLASASLQALREMFLILFDEDQQCATCDSPHVVELQLPSASASKTSGEG